MGADMTTGLEWVVRHGKGFGNETISRMIYEYTGLFRTRKQVSSHIQVLKNLLSEWMEIPAGLDHFAVDTEVDCRRKPMLVYDLIRSVSRNQFIVSIRLSQQGQSIGGSFHSLLMVSHWTRYSALQCLDSRTILDFVDDIEAIQSFVAVAEPRLLERIKHIRIDYIA